GSWVVIDPNINPDFMEMYADVESRGGILEPEGIVAIKVRRKRQIEAMGRLEAEYAEWKSWLASEDKSADESAELNKSKLELENKLLPLYNEAFQQFADLHDRSGRMKAKGAIRAELKWKEARRFLYWRLRRRLSEDNVVNRMLKKGITGGGEVPNPNIRKG